MAKEKKVLQTIIAIGLAILAAKILFPKMDLSLVSWAYLLALFLVIPTLALKKAGKAETFYFVSLLKTTRLNSLIEKISKPRLWDALADIGLVIGFGTIAVDYLYGRKQEKYKRALVAMVSAIALFTIFYAAMSPFFLRNGQEMQTVFMLFAAGFAIGGMMLFAIVSLVWQGSDIITKIMLGKTPCPGVAPIIPGVQIPNVPPALTPPLYIWGAFIIILVIHEFSHGALMRRAKVRLKSAGLLLLGLLPLGAFVEPDEEEIKAKPERQQLRVYAIGPASNIYSIAVFVAMLLAISLILTPTLGETVNKMEKEIMIDSIVITEVQEEYDICGNTVENPAKGTIEEGWILKKHNGIDLNSLYDFKQAFSKTDKNISMVFETREGETVNLELEKNEYGRIGIVTEISYVEGKGPKEDYMNIVTFLSTISTFFGWLLLLSFALATVNFLPNKPFDGGKIAQIMLVPYFGFMKMNKQDTQKLIERLALWLVATLIIINALPLFL